MAKAIQNAAATAAGAKMLRGFRLRWLVYGAAAYYALRLMSKNGIFAKQADAALDVIDRGIATAKERVGFTTTPAKGVAHEASQLSH